MGFRKGCRCQSKPESSDIYIYIYIERERERERVIMPRGTVGNVRNHRTSQGIIETIERHQK